MRIKISRNIIIRILLAIIMVMAGLLFVNSFESAKTLAWVIIALSLYSVVLVRKNWKSLIVYGFIAWSNYSICMASYISPVDSYFTRLNGDLSAIFGIKILFVFTIIICLFCTGDKGKIKIEFYDINTHGNFIIWITSQVILILIFYYGFTRPIVAGERGTPSTFYEYSMIIFIFSFLYAKRKTEKIITSVILLLFIMQNLMYGGRVTAIQLIIIWFLIIESDKVSAVRSILPVVLLLVIFSGIGIFRANYSVNANSIKLTIEKIIDNKLALDTAYSSYFTSLTFIKTVDKVNWNIRMDVFLKWLLSIPLGGSLVKGSNLAYFTRQYYVHYNGGIIPYFGYFYLGWSGVIVFSCYLLFLINKLTHQIYKNKKYSNLLKVLSIFFVASVPRWYLYSLSSITRGLLLVGIVWFLCETFDSYTTKQKTRGLGHTTPQGIRRSSII